MNKYNFWINVEWVDISIDINERGEFMFYIKDILSNGTIIIEFTHPVIGL